jgi:predicted O-methyltransferase YrrM
MPTIFERYPNLLTLKGLVPDEVVEYEIGKHADEFEVWRLEAKQKIKTVKLVDIFPAELEKVPIQLENFLGHWGNVTIEEVCKIALIAKYFKPKQVFEFGTYNGMTTLQLALNTPENTKIYTLDLSPEMASSTKFQLSELDRYVAAEFRSRFHTSVGSYFKGNPIEKKITQILSDSASYDYTPHYGTMDLIFIDAAHDYKNKILDTENALKMLAPNGILLWDNYEDVTNPFVTKYLNELADKLPIYHLRGTPLAVYWNKN